MTTSVRIPNWRTVLVHTCAVTLPVETNLKFNALQCLDMSKVSIRLRNSTGYHASIMGICCEWHRRNVEITSWDSFGSSWAGPPHLSQLSLSGSRAAQQSGKASHATFQRPHFSGKDAFAKPLILFWIVTRVNFKKKIMVISAAETCW